MDKSIDRTEARIPRATYRLQFHKDFTFDDAIAILPYLARLGVSHVYCSPIQRARPGSLHGYDVVAHDEVNPELGGQPGYERFSAALREHGLGQLLDVVPNHMGVGPDNPWWTDVLENGMASAYAGYFDIDWHPLNPELEGKVLLPVLGDHYGEALERGELTLSVDAAAGAFSLCYFDHGFPLSAAAVAAVLTRAAGHAKDGADAGSLPVLAAAFSHLQDADARVADEDTPGRSAAAQSFRESLARLLQTEPATTAAVQAALAYFNSEEGRDDLDKLIGSLPYRLSFWRVAADEINYRRFFDVNELAALRMERADVFEATQAFALDLAAAGTVDGLRIDHPDGLRDPARYFEDLQAGYARRREPDASTQDISRTPNRPARPLYVVAEKIAAGGEEVPESWAIHGTTGYRFANVANGVLVDTTAARRFDDIWRSFTGEHRDFETLSREGKRSIIRTGLSSELNVLSTELVRIARAHRRTRDYTLNAIRRALTEVAACMAVYRTYVIESPSEQDIRFVHAAVEAAKRESDETDLSVFDFVERTLLGRTLEGASAELQARVLRFAIRYQQFTAPVAAKGVEDTAFYRYFPLSSLNEVGGEPATFGLTVDQFHEASADRALRWPHTMLATSTHDNKRSEDVRNRIDVLSEIPEVWAESLERWAGMNDARRQSIAGGASSPSRQDEYLFYQALLGTLPADGLDDATLPAYRERIQQYMQKAVREAKSQTRWSQPDENYEAPLTALIDALLERVDDNQFLAEAQALSKRLSRAGAMNSISLMLLKYGSPGVPDLYQGNEIIDLSLVDPDNRRPVDYALRDRLLNAFEAGAGAGEISTMPPGLMAEPTDGRAKLWVIWRLLQLRRQDPELFRDGDYAGLQVVGEGSLNALAFSRTLGDRCLLIVAGRFFAADAQPPMSPRWPEARIVATSWPDGTRFRDALSGDVVQVRDGAIALSQACARLPGAALWRLSPTDSRRSI